MTEPPILLWLRRDLRLSDHPALDAACRSGRPVIPVFIHDETVEALGAAPKWRLGLGLQAFAEALEGLGSRLVLRRGPALEVLQALLAETGACGVHWTRLYDGASRRRDEAVKSALKGAGLEAVSHPGHVLFEPWEVETGTGGYYKVYSPFWRAVRNRHVAAPLHAPSELRTPSHWPKSEKLDDWAMGAAMRRGAAVVAPHLQVGEAAAQARLATFMRHRITGYRDGRDHPGRPATSGLSENLTYGEISARRVWHSGWRALEEGQPGAETFLKELVWRDFAWHLLYHAPDLAERNWREDWNGFPWRRDNAEAERWRRGMTGEPFVDAAIRELWVTGTMHNRARMIAASYLTKHLLTDWRVGLRFFEETLVDWDPASNAMGWQWVAGPGPDAAPYFRVFNPATQAEKFDRDAAYRRAWIAEGQARPPETALDFFRACPERWGLAPGQDYPEPVVGLAEGRARALDAYDRRAG